MNQKKFHDAVYALRDGELSPAERGEILSHLEGCSECRDIRDRWPLLSAPLAKSRFRPSPGETERFARVVMARIRQEVEAVPVWISWLGFRWVLPAVGVGVVAVSMFVMTTGFDLLAPPDDQVLASQSQGVAAWVLPPDMSSSDNPWSAAQYDQ